MREAAVEMPRQEQRRILKIEMRQPAARQYHHRNSASEGERISRKAETTLGSASLAACATPVDMA